MYSSDLPILFQFCRLVVKIVSKELQVLFWTFTVIMETRKSLDEKFVQKVDVAMGYFLLPLQLMTLEVWNPVCNSVISVYSTG